MKTNTAWAFAGNSVYAGCQWAVFVLLVKALNIEEAGAFAYATAVTGPIFVLATVRLRNLLATRATSQDDFGDYLTARLLTTTAAILASLVIGALVSSRTGSFAVLAVMTIGRSCDALSDICHGLFQRELDMRSAAIGLTINGVASLALVVLAVAFWPSIVLATAAYAGGSLLAFAGWDLPRALEKGSDPFWGISRKGVRPLFRSGWRLIRTALPLGLSSAIGSVQTNVPRYVIAAFLGPAALARFAAISYVTMAGHLIVNATSQAALPMLARDARQSDRRYRARLGRLVAGTIVLGALCVATAFLVGRPLLAIVYGREYAAYGGVLLWLVAATVMTFASVFLGAGTTARQRFNAQLRISAASLVVVAVCASPLIRRYGLTGAALSLLAGAAVELCAYAVLTVRDLGRTFDGDSHVRRSSAMAQARPTRLRVLHVFGRLERGGAELRFVELAEAFPRDRVQSDFLVLTGLDGILDDRVRAAGGDVIKCRLALRFPRELYRLLRERRYDVVNSHVHYFSGVILAIAWLAGVRGRVAHLHMAIVNDREDSRARRAQLAICRTLLDRTATDIVAVGDGVMTGAWREGWPADPRCQVIYSGIRSERLPPPSPFRTGRPTIVCVGSIKPLKNQLRLIRVLRRVVARFPDVRLQLVGKEIGDYGEKVRRAAEDAGLSGHVEFVGEVDEPLHWIAAAHVAILPSLWEGLPCAVLEACAIGTPAVASDLPGTRELAFYFSHLQVVSLDEDDEVWAQAVTRHLEATSNGTRDSADAAACLARSPFRFDRAVEAHFNLWSRSHAPA
jgi:O-antigen/teichoic acid export membrane protein/glycosyltransferase involved in cell wall biosynthesis